MLIIVQLDTDVAAKVDVNVQVNADVDFEGRLRIDVVDKSKGLWVSGYLYDTMKPFEAIQVMACHQVEAYRGEISFTS